MTGKTKLRDQKRNDKRDNRHDQKRGHKHNNRHDQKRTNKRDSRQDLKRNTYQYDTVSRFGLVVRG